MDGPNCVLVVDDDAPTRRLMVEALTREAAHEVLVAAQPSAALQVLAERPDVDVIITDLALPQYSGLQMIEQIRRMGLRTPILVLSSLQTDSTLARAMEVGADDYLQKPVDLKELRRVLSGLMREGAHRQAQASQTAEHPEFSSHADGTFVELTLATDTAQADRFQRFAERLVHMSLGEKDRHNLRLALEEIVRNAIEWGNRFDRGKKLRLSYCVLQDRITFRIEDEGTGFNPGNLADPSRDPAAHIKSRRESGKRMGGWGVFLARKMVDEVRYNAKGNVVFLTKYLRQAPDSSLYLLKGERALNGAGDQDRKDPPDPNTLATKVVRWQG